MGIHGYSRLVTKCSGLISVPILATENVPGQMSQLFWILPQLLSNIPGKMYWSQQVSQLTDRNDGQSTLPYAMTLRERHECLKVAFSKTENHCVFLTLCLQKLFWRQSQSEPTYWVLWEATSPW